MKTITVFTPVSHTKPTSCSESALSLEEFKEKLTYFSTYDKDSNRIAKDLFKFSPKTLKLAEIVDLIFEQCIGYTIIPVLDAILTARPSFTLSPYDKIRRTIVEDKGHILNNLSFGFFKQSRAELPFYLN